ncbi:protein kinase [Telmatocola sphagniphila]|uniref:non-specific serine/threonine protein kinase n=1 Tax=Telmatocola sphagniphila TaxID=1123043 RepID=A0A8E6EUE2_9BACT|nr:protein kinase [Telmatocola sphagniphila]QVL33604.1 protein kinase [Telmatocola sphagniphila]
MVVGACPRCSKSLPDLDIPPLFCPYCGTKIRGSSTPYPHSNLHTTAEFQPHSIPDSSTADEKVPENIGGYKLGALLGSGGMGQVYEANSLSSNETVAVKLLSTRLSSSPISLERFRQEGRLASQISHPLCVFVYAADTENGRPYIVMERMPGNTLKDYVEKKGTLPVQESIQLILDVIDGLREAHRLGFIHRDVKPSNCFLTKDGRVKIGDFGLSRSLTRDGSLTQTGAFLGTVLYASPEQIKGEPVDFSSDVYSVSATLYFLLTGRAPFQQDNMTAALAQVISEDAPPIRRFRKEIPKNLESILARGLERDRDRRFPDLEELRAALVALIPGSMRTAGFSVKIGAFILDDIFVELALIQPCSYFIHDYVNGFLLNISKLLIFFLYFALCEWRFGGTPGKRIFRLRVCRNNSTEAPSFTAILLRTAIFCLMIGFEFWEHSVLGESTNAVRAERFFYFLWVVVGLLLLYLPMRSRLHRGLHDRLSKTCVLRLPPRTYEVRLYSSKEDRLRTLPPLPQNFQFDLKPYVLHRGDEGPTEGEWTVLGEDKMLGRNLLFHIQPKTNELNPQRRSLQRTARLRLLNSGELNQNGKSYCWSAYIAPSGAPLSDIATTKHRLPWSETRLIVEQLVDELLEARKDGTLPSSLNLDQVWLQHDGRMQLLDFPVKSYREKEIPTVNDGIHLVRQAICLALQGDIAKLEKETDIEAPIPSHARTMIQNSLIDSREESLLNLKKMLVETRNQPQRVNTSMRLFQICLMGAFLSIGLLTMFSTAGLYTVMLVAAREHLQSASEDMLRAMRHPERHPEWRKDPEVQKFLASNSARKDVEELLNASKLQLDKHRKGLTAIGRFIVSQFRTKAEQEQNLLPHTHLVIEEIERHQAAGEPIKSLIPIEKDWYKLMGLILGIPLTWALLSFAWRGSPSLTLSQIRLVTLKGEPAKRWVYLLRTLAVWLPIGLLLSVSVLFQANYPGWVSSHAFVWWLAFSIIIGYVVHALRNPEQSWLDERLNLILVPK